MVGDAASPPDALAPYDGVLLASFGGPERPGEVMPFLHRVTAGRGVSQERLDEVAQHYLDRDGCSPLPAENRRLTRALEAELARRGTPRPVLLGNRFAPPFLADTVAQAAQTGHRRLAAVPTSAYPSYSGCRAYRDTIAAALRDGAPPDARTTDAQARLQVDTIRPYALHPGFSATNSRLVTDATRTLLARTGLPAGQVRLVFVTHSIPVVQDLTSGPPRAPGVPTPERGLYRSWHAQLTRAIIDEVSATLEVTMRGDLTYCSRSGPPGQPWLEPDVNEYLQSAAADGARGIVLAPIGFTSDHMEVVYDLDTEAAATARVLGLAFTRVPTVRADPEFVTGLADLLLERAAEARDEVPRRPCWPRVTPLPSQCVPGCCPAPARPSRPGSPTPKGSR
ncbi:MAG: ferrochelatase [Dermatophilaceae bacterium]